MLTGNMRMLANIERMIGNKDIPIIWQVVNNDSKLFLETWVIIAAATQAVWEAILQFETQSCKSTYTA